MVAELAARGPFEMLTRTFRAIRMDKKKRNESGTAQNFVDHLLSSPVRIHWNWEGGTHSWWHRNSVLGQCFNSGTGFRDLKVYLAPLPSRHCFGKHTFAALARICTCKCLSVCSRVCAHVAHALLSWCSSCIGHRVGCWILLQQLFHFATLGVCSCLCVR